MGKSSTRKTPEMEVVCKSCGRKSKIVPQSVYRDYDSFFSKYYWYCTCGDSNNRVLVKDMNAEFKRMVKLLNQNRAGVL